MERLDEFIIEDKKEARIVTKQDFIKLKLEEKKLMEGRFEKDNIFLEWLNN